jgi:SNF2 family DNA or RNA helicase
MNYEARAWQKIGTKWLLDNPRGMLVADPGLGKTSMVLSALDLLKLAGSNFFPALIVGPKRVADVVWTGERDKWTTFQNLSIVKVMGEQDLRMAALRQSVADAYLINYDLVPWLCSIFPAEKWPFRIVICDESSRLKGFRLNKGRVRANALSTIARHTGRWWNLTGTPCPNGLQDLWGQMWYVDFGERLKRSYSAYLEAYFLEDRYTRKITTQFAAEPEIHRLVADKMLVLRAADWLDLEKPQEIPMDVNLPPEVRAQYRAMEKDYFLELADTQIEAGTAAVKSIKLLQMCSGSIYDEDTMPHHLHDVKLEALDDILEEIAPKPLLVAYWWKTDVPRILNHLAKLNIPARVYSGKQDEDDWNAGKIRVLLLQEQSAFGLSLHMPCHDLCFYSYFWNAELYTQMLARIGPVRQAQAGFKRVVRVWTIRTRGTIEADVQESNAQKISIEQALKAARARVLQFGDLR